MMAWNILGMVFGHVARNIRPMMAIIKAAMANRIARNVKGSE